MSPNQRLPLGGYRKINTAMRGTRWRAFTRVRDLDGVTRQVEATAANERRAVDALHAALAVRVPPTPEFGAAPTVAVFAEMWLARIAAEGRLAGSTVKTYSGAVRDRLIPGIGAWHVRECTPASVSRFLEREVAAVSGRARTVRVTLKGVLDLAITQGAMPGPNPVDSAIPIRAATPDPRSLTPSERSAVLAAFRATGSDRLVDAALILMATGARIAELLALRPVDWDSTTRTLAITGQVETGPTRRVEHTKSDSGFRALVLPLWAAEVLDRRAPGASWFFQAQTKKSFHGAGLVPVTPANLRADWRAALPPELCWVTPKTMRKTVASLIGNEDETAGWKQLGHRDGSTMKHYLDRVLPVSDNSLALEGLDPELPARTAFAKALATLAAANGFVVLGKGITSWTAVVKVSPSNRRAGAAGFPAFQAELAGLVGLFSQFRAENVVLYYPQA